MSVSKKYLVLAFLVLFSLGTFAEGPRNDHWKVIGPGGGGSIYAPTMSPHNSNDMLAYCDMTGAYISHDGGTSWRMFNLRGRVHFYLFDPVDPNVIYVETIGLWRSTDRGNTWRLVYPAPTSVTGVIMPDDHASDKIMTQDPSQGSVSALAVDPVNSKILYATILENGTNTFATSKDWGATWQRDGDLPGFDAMSVGALGGSERIFVDPASPQTERTIYVIGTNSISVRRNGAWHQFNPPPDVKSFTEYTGGFSAGVSKPIFYVTSRKGAFVSNDGGESWSGVKLPGIEGRVHFSGIGASFHHPEVAYVSYDNGRNQSKPFFGFAKTTDAGRTWTIPWDESDPNHLHKAWIEERNGFGRNTEDVGVSPTDPNRVFGSDSMRMVRRKLGSGLFEASAGWRLDKHWPRCDYLLWGTLRSFRQEADVHHLHGYRPNAQRGRREKLDDFNDRGATHLAEHYLLDCF